MATDVQRMRGREKTVRLPFFSVVQRSGSLFVKIVMAKLPPQVLPEAPVQAVSQLSAIPCLSKSVP